MSNSGHCFKRDIDELEWVQRGTMKLVRSVENKYCEQSWKMYHTEDCKDVFSPAPEGKAGSNGLKLK